MRSIFMVMLLLATPCCLAQGMPREAWSVEAARAPGARYLFGFETDVLGKDDAVRWQAADGLVSAPILTNPQRSLFVSGSYRYIGLDNRRNSLPPRLIDTGLTGFGNFAVGDYRLTAFVNATMRSDADGFIWNAFTINASIGLRIPIDEHWSVTPSIFFTTGVRDQGGFSLRYIPLPGVNFAWKPSDKFDLEFGLTSAKLNWKPYEWLTLQAGYTFPYGGSVRVTEQPVSWFRVTQFFGRYSDRYVLTGERWAEDHLIKLESYAVGVTHEFLVPLTGDPDGVKLAFGLTYALGIGGKARVWNYVEDDELFELKTAPSHSVGLTISLLFGPG